MVAVEADLPGVGVAMRPGVALLVRRALATSGRAGLQAAGAAAKGPATTNTTATAGWQIATAEEVLRRGVTPEKARTTTVGGPIGSVPWRASMARTTPAVPRKR